MSDAILDVQGLVGGYGKMTILNGTTFQVPAGSITTVIGPNGAGKSTVFKAIFGLLKLREGKVIFRGRDVTGLSPRELLAAGICYVPQGRNIFPELSVWENLDIARRTGAGGKTIWREEQVFALFPDLAEIRDRRGGVLSGGQQQMLTIARTLMGNPELLLLDEPSEGLAPLIVEQLLQRVAELKATGLSIVLAEQNLEFVLALADRVYILEKGEVRFTGTPADLRADERIVHQFLTV